MTVKKVDGRPVITQADPICRVSGELMESFFLDECLPWAKVNEDTLTFTDAGGQRFIYRINDYDAETDTWEIEWPD